MQRDMLVKTYLAATAGGVPPPEMSLLVDGEMLTFTREEMQAAQRHRAFEIELGRLCGARIAARRRRDAVHQ